MKYYDDQEWTGKELVTKVIHNGDVTIMFGLGEPNLHLDMSLSDLGKELVDQYGGDPWDRVVQTKGVARKSPEDEYNESRGRKIASRRAEYKAARALRNRYNETMAKLYKAMVRMQQEMDSLDHRMQVIQSDLEEEATR